MGTVSTLMYIQHSDYLTVATEYRVSRDTMLCDILILQILNILHKFYIVPDLNPSFFGNPLVQAWEGTLILPPGKKEDRGEGDFDARGLLN